MVRRPKQLPPRAPLTSAQIEAASYVGSPEHKARRWWGGLPAGFVGPKGEVTRPKKQQTTLCPLTSEADRQRATAWVRSALAAGQLKYLEGDKDFPARIWYFDNQSSQLWIGYCVNGVLGHFKGWPIDEEERVAVFG
jgi:hypothetical protein